MTLVALKELKKEVKNLIDDADEETVKAIRAMLENEREDDWWDTLPDEVKAGIDEGLKDMEEGRVMPHEEVGENIASGQQNSLVRKISENI